MKNILIRILILFGCKDIGLISYSLRHFNLKLLIDGIFFGKYQYTGTFSGTILEHAKSINQYSLDKKKKIILIDGLDSESIETINQLEKSIQFVVDNKNPYFMMKSFGISPNKYKVNKHIEEYTKNIYLPIDSKEDSVFYYKHGINEIENIKDLLKGKDIIDCGAYIGDSAIMFSKEINNIKNIYCLEPDPQNLKLLKETISKNHMEGKIIPIPLGVGKNKETLYFNTGGIASSVGKKNSSSITINVDKIDNIVKDFGINPGLIKRDVEGQEYDSILGSKETIKKYHPILLISIYHTGKDFYEIKPLIESWNLGYKFKIRHLSVKIFEETMLICY